MLNAYSVVREEVKEDRRRFRVYRTLKIRCKLARKRLVQYATAVPAVVHPFKKHINARRT